MAIFVEESSFGGESCLTERPNLTKGTSGLAGCGGLAWIALDWQSSGGNGEACLLLYIRPTVVSPTFSLPYSDLDAWRRFG